MSSHFTEHHFSFTSLFPGEGLLSYDLLWFFFTVFCDQLFRQYIFVPNSLVNDTCFLGYGWINMTWYWKIIWRLIINFVSTAAITWAVMRRQWVGHQAEVPKKAPREPVIRFLSNPLPFAWIIICLSDGVILIPRNP